ncbi:MAG: PH domain-containing protein [Capnocytophaga sp.]|nr:PH domain-containing protein [Capnocytophaga sp.]
MTLQQTSPNEMVYQTKIHWISFIKPILFMVIGFPFLLFLFFTKEWIYLIIFGAIGFLGIKGMYIYCYLKRIRVILSKRFLSLKMGLFSNEINDIALSKTEGIGIYQSLLGRLLNYGTLIITTGEVTQKYLIEKPMEFRTHLLENLEKER